MDELLTFSILHIIRRCSSKGHEHTVSHVIHHLQSSNGLLNTKMTNGITYVYVQPTSHVTSILCTSIVCLINTLKSSTS